MQKILALPLNTNQNTINLLGGFINKVMKRGDKVFIPSSTQEVGNIFLDVIEPVNQKQTIKVRNGEILYGYMKSEEIYVQDDRDYLIQLLEKADVLVLVGNIDDGLIGKPALLARYARAQGKIVHNLEESNQWSVHIKVNDYSESLLDYADCLLIEVFEYMGDLIIRDDYSNIKDEFYPYVGKITKSYTENGNARQLIYTLEGACWYCTWSSSNMNNPVISNVSGEIGQIISRKFISCEQLSSVS